MSARYHLGVPEISLPEAIAVVVVATAAYVWRRALGENADLEYELEEDEWTILEILTVAGGEQVGNHAIERALSDLSAIRVRHHLDRLVQLGLVEEFVSEEYMPLEGGDRWYELTPEGRDFAVEHHLDE